MFENRPKDILLFLKVLYVLKDYRENALSDITFPSSDRDASLTIIGGIHGDEPAGVEVVNRFRDSDLELEKPVQSVIANPNAVEKCERYVEKDLNRAYPGDKNGKLEEQIASEIVDVIEDTKVLSVHTTHSTDIPFAIFDFSNEDLIEIVDKLSVPYAVDPSPIKANTLSQYGCVIELEAGRQYSESAVEKAQKIVDEFLYATDALEGSTNNSVGTEYFEMFEAVGKPEYSSEENCDSLYDFNAENFEKVERGEVYAKYKSNELRADSGFYPILMSQCGYEEIFGFKGHRLDKY